MVGHLLPQGSAGPAPVLRAVFETVEVNSTFYRPLKTEFAGYLITNEGAEGRD
jgi:uncharacterized protein YecE (DUF72 family)